jgi:peptide/nickel transport system permease protein
MGSELTAVKPVEIAFEEATARGKSLWRHAFARLVKDRLAVGGLVIIAFYSLIAILAKFGILASPWDQVVGGTYQVPSLSSSIDLWLGTDMFGRSVLYKVIHGTRIAMSVGLVTSLISIPIGVLLGALAGYFGGWIDELIVWFYTTVSSIPSIMLLIAIAYVMGRGIVSIYIAIGAVSWIGLARLIRSEFIKHKNRDYVVAAESLGASHQSRIFNHILPNVSHLIIIHLSLQFQVAIWTEVILSYLGLGVQGQPSWGIMIDDAKLELTRGVWWQLEGATFAMFLIVLALNIVGDALRDALDPKIK